MVSGAKQITTLFLQFPRSEFERLPVTVREILVPSVKSFIVSWLAVIDRTASLQMSSQTDTLLPDVFKVDLFVAKRFNDSFYDTLAELLKVRLHVRWKLEVN